MNKNLILILLFVFLAPILIGSFFSPKAFFLNILAGLSCIGLSFFIGYFIVNRYIQRKEERQWSSIYQIFSGIIKHHLSEINSAISSFFSIEEYPFFKVEVMDLEVEKFKKWNEVLQNWDQTAVAKEYVCILNQLYKIENERKIDSFNWSEFSNIITDDISNIRDYSLRIFQAPGNQRLKDNLFKMEEAFHDLESLGKSLRESKKTEKNAKSFLEESKGNNRESEIKMAKFAYKKSKKLNKEYNILIFEFVKHTVESCRDLYKNIWEYENLNKNKR